MPGRKGGRDRERERGRERERERKRKRGRETDAACLGNTVGGWRGHSEWAHAQTPHLYPQSVSFPHTQTCMTSLRNTALPFILHMTVKKMRTVLECEGIEMWFCN